ncbi:hypothetical protein PAEPH01_2527 [Pancytospora epiphaga]|nr:hypothetical protein PAEPH01_2527 [Pancytospora epiphaga]
MKLNSTAMIQNLLNQCKPLEPEDRVQVLLKLLIKEIDRHQNVPDKEQLKCYKDLLMKVTTGLGLETFIYSEDQENIFNGVVDNKGEEIKACKAMVVIKKEEKDKGIMEKLKNNSYFFTGILTSIMTIIIIKISNLINF